MFYYIFVVVVLVGCGLFFLERIIEFYKLNKKRIKLSEYFFKFLFKQREYYEKKKSKTFEYFSKLQYCANNKTLKDISSVNYRILEVLCARKLFQDRLVSIFKDNHKIIWSFSDIIFKVDLIESLFSSIKEADKNLGILFSKFKKLLDEKTKRS